MRRIDAVTDMQRVLSLPARVLRWTPSELSRLCAYLCVCRPNVCGSGRHGRRCCAGWTRAPGSARCLVRTSFHLLTCTKQGSCLENEIMQGTMPGARRRGRPRTAWMDNIKTWTGLSVEKSVRMTKDRDEWRKYVHGVANPRIEDG